MPASNEADTSGIRRVCTAPALYPTACRNACGRTLSAPDHVSSPVRLLPLLTSNANRPRIALYIMNTLYALAQSSELFLIEASPRRYVKDIFVKRHCPSIFTYALS